MAQPRPLVRANGQSSGQRDGQGQNSGAELVPYRDAVPALADNSWAPPSLGAASEGAPKVSALRAGLDLLVRRRRVVLPIFLLVVLFGVVSGWSQRRVYQATATLLANTAPLGGDGKNKNNGSISTGDVDGVNQGRNLETQMQILRTPAVIRGAFAKLSPEQQKSLKSFYNVEIATVRNTDLITVAATSYDPKSSAALANAICQSYIEQSQENNRREVGGTARFVKGQLETVHRAAQAGARRLPRLSAAKQHHRRRHPVHHGQRHAQHAQKRPAPN